MAKSTRPTGSEAVDAYLAALKHPLKAEIGALREIILAANPKVQERVKWNAPSFYYQDDIAAFNPRAKGFVQIVFVFHRGRMIEGDYGLLTGDYKDRRLARFDHMADIRAKQAALVRVINRWVAMTDGEL
ncbi:MAG TPA: DUF1801 domain-containing protein [Pseudoxanthomonas sp.]|nr:DUF1801 domain-containing protein [Pseudoxanthomonas sp.]